MTSSVTTCKEEATAFHEIGKRVWQVREQRGLGLRELAAKAGLSHSLLSEVEMGKRYLVASGPALATVLGPGVFEIVLAEARLRERMAGIAARAETAALQLIAKQIPVAGRWTQAPDEPTQEQVERELLRRWDAIRWSQVLTPERLAEELRISSPTADEREVLRAVCERWLEMLT